MIISIIGPSLSDPRIESFWEKKTSEQNRERFDCMQHLVLALPDLM